MKVKAFVDCNGYGYEDFKAGEERNVRKEIAELLINFGYAESVEPKRKKPEEEPNEPPED